MIHMQLSDAGCQQSVANQPADVLNLEVTMPCTLPNHYYHIILGTRSRAPLITPTLERRLYDCIRNTIRDAGATFHAIGGMAEHVHVVVEFPADFPISDLVWAMKLNSSRLAKDVLGPTAGFAWQEGYGAFLVRESWLLSMEFYVRNQEVFHGSRSFEEEFLWLLEEYRREKSMCGLIGIDPPCRELPRISFPEFPPELPVAGGRSYDLELEL